MMETMQRRNELINKLIMHKVYKKGERQLFELTIEELEEEFRSVKKECHPHTESGSIHWINCIKVTV
ncbi:Fur-regulated basic protein FbpA [Rossellomorea marisflavi]|uniref:Fur-regulated basic protein FbpA n=1 Tax=Rossellomorea marisflavi TaxID=189381 RepID=UPI00295F4FB3|nr:Fur-regulated basic protein FbpA [Rossellomorea marisflavi]